MKKRTDKYTLEVNDARFAAKMSLPSMLDLLQAAIEHDSDADIFEVEIRVHRHYWEEDEDA